jgi:2-iminobutanoate/2-iminopropanoate deaminase
LEVRELIETDDAPGPIGPYAQAVKAGGFVFLSGQIALRPGSGELAGPGIVEQTRQVMENLKAILEASGSSLQKIVKTTIYVTDLGDFAALNGIYGEYVGSVKPARATVEVARLPKEALVLIEAVALA